MHPIWRIYKPDITRDPENPERFDLQAGIAGAARSKRGLERSKVAAPCPLPSRDDRYRGALSPGNTRCGSDLSGRRLRGRDRLTLAFRTAGQLYEILIPVRGRAIPLPELKRLNKRPSSQPALSALRE